MNKLIFHSVLPIIFLCALAMLAAGSARAQEQKAQGRPSMGGHSFTETVDVPSPTIHSFVRNRLGMGQALNLEIPPIEVGGEQISGLEGNLLFAILDFEYQYAIKDWIAIRARLVGSGRLGSDTLALLYEGVTMSTGYELGWLIHLQEREKTALSLDLNLSNRSFTGVNISQFVDDIIGEKPATLVNKTPAARGSAGLRFAWGLSPLVGVSARYRTGYGESIDRHKGDVWFWSFAGSVDFDLRTKTTAPLGLAAGFKYDNYPEFGADVTQGVSTTFIRVSYLGREDFLMSLDLAHDKIPLSSNRPDMKTISVTLSLRYYI